MGINRKSISLLTALMLVLAAHILPAQEISISTRSVEENGKYYLIHTVMEKQTLYSISRAYKVTVNEILFENPALTNGLKAGAEIRIPATMPGSKKKEKSQTDFDTSGKYILHTVERKQTMYAIAKMYSTDIALIRSANADLDEENLKQGTIIRIPQPEIKAAEVPAVLPPAASSPDSKSCLPLKTTPYLTKNRSPMAMPFSTRACPRLSSWPVFALHATASTRQA
jgi:LysM repeat protein